MNEQQTNMLVTERIEEEPQKISSGRKVWNFLKTRKIWWITPLVLLLILFLLSYFAGKNVSLDAVYAPV